MPVISLNGVQLDEVTKVLQPFENNPIISKGVKDDPLTLFTWEDEPGGKRRKRDTEEDLTSKVGFLAKLDSKLLSCFSIATKLQQLMQTAQRLFSV